MFIQYQLRALKRGEKVGREKIECHHPASVRKCGPADNDPGDQTGMDTAGK